MLSYTMCYRHEIEERTHATEEESSGESPVPDREPAEDVRILTDGGDEE